MKLLVLLSVWGLLAFKVDSSTCPTQCKGSVIQPSPVKEYCNKYNLTLINHDRCCINGTDTSVVGMDLTNCSLRNLTGLFDGMSSLAVLSLNGNPDLSVTANSFYNLTELSLLYMPLGKKKQEVCPGGLLAWEKTGIFSETVWLCEGQRDTCHNKENNETCPTPQSYCVSAGPGIVDCVCSPDYHGYKCLRQGSFPMIPFIGGICGSTLVVSVFLWVTQRRFVKKQA